MDWERFSTDEIEQRVAGDEQLISQLRARQMDALAELDRRQVASADGARSMSEWTATRFDKGPDTARSLVRTMRRLQDRPDLKSDLAAGDLSFDRVEALSRIPDEIGHMLHADVAGVRREAAKRARITAGSEYRSPEGQFLVMQPALDESWWKVWGGLDGPTGAVVDKTLTEKADSLPVLPDGSTGSQGWRKAMALAEVCVSGEAPPAQVTVFVDAQLASESNGEIGVMIDAGPKAGRQALEAILFDASTEIIVNGEDGVPLSYGRRTRTVPPQLRRTVIHGAGGVCSADGCNSRYRIEAADSLSESVCSSLCELHQHDCPLVARWHHRPGQSGGIVLVPPPHSHPPERLHDLPASRDRKNPVPQTTPGSTYLGVPRARHPGPSFDQDRIPIANSSRSFLTTYRRRPRPPRRDG